MPTGYTAGILDGEIETFEQFAKQCTRAFGATIHMRDEPLSKGWEESKPSDYHLDRIKQSEDELIKLESISDEELRFQELERLDKDEAYHIEKQFKQKKNRDKLNFFIKKAEAWEPPTTDHEEFKEFMIKQLKSTIDFDCKSTYHDDSLASIV